MATQRSRFFFDSDGVNYGLSLKSYDLYQYQPHPLGDPLYVATGKLLLFFTGDEREAVWAASFLGYALLLLFIVLVVGRSPLPSAGAKVLLVATSPLLVKESLVVNPDIWEGTLFLYAFLIADHFDNKKKWRPFLFFLLGVSLGFRLNLLYYLSLLLLYFHFKLVHEKDFSSLLLFWVGIFLWFIPFLEIVGGLGAYLKAIEGRQEMFGISVFVMGPAALWRNIRQIGLGIVYGFGAGIFLLPLIYWFARPVKKTLLLLFLPSLTYFILIVCNVSNYLTAATAVGIFLLVREKRLPIALLLLPLFLNLLILWRIVLPSLHFVDDYWGKRVSCVREHFPPGKTLLYFELHYGKTQYFFFRHAYVYLPEYTLLYRASGEKKKWWWKKRGQLSITSSLPLPEKELAHRIVVYGNEGEGKGETVSCQGEKFYLQRGKDFLEWLKRNGTAH